MDKLENLFTLQAEFEKRFFDFKSMTEKEKQLITIEFLGHLFEELAECRAELPLRKHWEKDGVTDQRKLKLEIIDCFHFLITICLIWGFDFNDIYKTFLHKHEVNINRQDSWNYGKDKSKL